MKPGDPSGTEPRGAQVHTWAVVRRSGRPGNWLSMASTAETPDGSRAHSHDKESGQKPPEDPRDLMAGMTARKKPAFEGWGYVFLGVFFTICVEAAVLFGGYHFVFGGGSAAQETSLVPARDQARIDQNLEAADPSEPINILLLGSDERGGEGPKRADTIMLAQVDPENAVITVVSFPRDLYVRIPKAWVPYQKINAAYAIDGIPLTIETVKEYTGLPIHHYAMLDFEGFTETIDALGGVEVDVDKRYYEEGHSNIDLQPGQQMLDGRQALSYVRFRNDDKGDFGRIQRQQIFLRALRERLLSVQAFASVPELVRIADTYSETNMTSSEMIALADVFFRASEKTRVETITLTGTETYLPDAGYVIMPDQQRNNEVLSTLKSSSPVLKDPAESQPVESRHRAGPARDAQESSRS